MLETDKYYQQNFNGFIENTLNIDLSEIYSKFVPLIKTNGNILDIGCGSGRDSLYFKNQGFILTAIDNNLRFIEHTKDYAGVEAYQLDFAEIKFLNKFDGIWACASLLHEKKENLTDIFLKMSNALKENGIIYLSFKYGTFSGIRDNRFFTDMNEELLDSILSKVNQLSLIESWVTEDKRKDRNEKWLNILLRKVN